MRAFSDHDIRAWCVNAVLPVSLCQCSAVSDGLPRQAAVRAAPATAAAADHPRHHAAPAAATNAIRGGRHRPATAAAHLRVGTARRAPATPAHARTAARWPAATDGTTHDDGTSADGTPTDGTSTVHGTTAIWTTTRTLWPTLAHAATARGLLLKSALCDRELLCLNCKCSFYL